MPNLATIPLDIRLEIARHTVDSYYKLAHCGNLSLVCRSLNEACEPIIFSKYRLDIRTYHWPIKKVYPLGSSTSRWDEATIKLRFAHLRSKAQFVRELIITDMGRDEKHDCASGPAKAFPFEFISELLPLLQALPGVTSVGLVGPTTSVTSLHIDLWNWLVCTSPRALDLNGQFEIDVPAGRNLEPIKNLYKLSLYPHGIYFNPLLEILHPNTLTVKYAYDLSGRQILSSRDLVPFRPTSSKLKSIFVGINALYTTFDEPVLDFSAVLHAKINVEVYFHVEYKMHVPSTWRSTKPKIKKILAEDLSGFDVSRAVKSTCVRIFRSPDSGWVPARQDHIGSEELDQKEEKSMQAYYRSKSREWSSLRRGF